MESLKSKKNKASTTINREIKDGIFRLLFNNNENAAELYYALTGIKCKPDEILIITLETTISGKLKNDLAFIVNGRALIVGEHQSTPNKNMPIRILLYIGQLYDKWFGYKGDGKLIYGTALYKIPRPQFAVFYNGTAKRPSKEILKLSSAFEDNEDGETGVGYLELEVPVYNINKGMSDEIVSKSKLLLQYSEFIAKLRENQEIYDDSERAAKETVSYCMANDILTDFLKEMGGSIMSILQMEYDVEMAKKVYREEQREEIAIEMLQNSEPIEKIIRYTKLSFEAIEQLKRRIGY